MKVSLVGGGMMGMAILFDLLKFQLFDEIQVIEKNAHRIEHLWKRFPGQDNLTFVQLDVTDRSRTEGTLLGSDVLISALPYQFNFDLLELSLEIGAHFLDLGGNETILAQQLSLDKKARNLGLIALPGCGLAPGLVSILAIDGIQKMDEVETVRIYCGGLPQSPKPPLNYQIVFSPHGLLNEYLGPVKILSEGNLVEKSPLSDLETLRFPRPFGKMEAFLTSGGAGTLIYTQRERVKNLYYKTLRYPGHAEKFKLLLELGLASEETIQIKNVEVSPREMFERLLEKQLMYNEPDIVLIRVIVEGRKEERVKKLLYDIIDRFDKKEGLTAMMRMTGFSVAIATQLIIEDKIQGCGVLPLENAIPPHDFFNRLEERGIQVKTRES